MEQQKLVEQLKSVLTAMSDEAMLELAAGRSAVAIFPEAADGHTVQAHAYFAQDVRDGAAEQYWDQYGPRATLVLDVVDVDLCDMGQEQFEALVEGGSIAVKAQEIRLRVLASDLADAVKDALTEISDREAA